MTLRGFDASVIQGILDPASLTEYRFAFLKCQQGNDGKDPVFEKNRKALTEAGIVVGAYHFAYPLPHLDPKAQAKLFYDACPDITLVALDFEWPAPEQWAKWSCTPVQVGEWTRICLEEMTRLYGRRPIVYTYPWFCTALIRGGADLAFLIDYPLWIASYSKEPVIPEPWKTVGWLFWQDDGNDGKKLPNGVDADFDLFNGTEEDLQDLVQIYDHADPTFTDSGEPEKKR